MKKLTTLLTVLVLLVLTACSSSLKVELKEKIEIEYGSELKCLLGPPLLPAGRFRYSADRFSQELL